jgi:hypothetical protein
MVGQGRMSALRPDAHDFKESLRAAVNRMWKQNRTCTKLRPNSQPVGCGKGSACGEVRCAFALTPAVRHVTASNA